MVGCTDKAGGYGLKIWLKYGLPFTTVELAYQGLEVEIPDVLIDTGSATTMISADFAAQVGIYPEDSDMLYTLCGIGGVEVVYSRQTDRLAVETKGIDRFTVEVGGMDYGFDIKGILGMDFLVSTGACIDLRALEMNFLL